MTSVDVSLLRQSKYSEASFEDLTRRVEALEKEIKSLRGIVFVSLKKKK